MASPLHVHPHNPKCFEFRGRPLVLVTATEHYGAVMNRPFRFERYLANAAANRMTLTRLFVLFRELQCARNPYSTCKPESPDYIAPFERTGPGTALDGEPKFDLDRPNPEFFDRLHRFLSLASGYGIVVEVVLLSNTYVPDVWALNPLNSRNNVNGLDDIRWQDYMSLRNGKLFERQAAHVRRIVEETNRYDNVMFEICNEPGGAHPERPENPSVDEVNAWQAALRDAIVRTEAALPHRHLVVGQEAFTWSPWEQSSTKTFHDLPFDVVNVHPLPGTTYRGASYDMGQFMSKQLRLRGLRDYCLATYDAPKPLNLDEDNVASQYKDIDGWTIHRKRAWTTLLSGAHYDYIDFSIIPGRETGTEESRRCIRTWMRHLSEFVHSFDLVRVRPLPGFVWKVPTHSVASAFAVEGEDYAVYLADQRELSEPGCGDEMNGEIAVVLPEGRYRVACYSPTTGLYSPATRISGGSEVALELPGFRHDLALRINRV